MSSFGRTKSSLGLLILGLGGVAFGDRLMMVPYGAGVTATQQLSALNSTTFSGKAQSMAFNSTASGKVFSFQTVLAEQSASAVAGTVFKPQVSIAASAAGDTISTNRTLEITPDCSDGSTTGVTATWTVNAAVPGSYSDNIWGLFACTGAGCCDDPENMPEMNKDFDYNNTTTNGSFYTPTGSISGASGGTYASGTYICTYLMRTRYESHQLKVKQLSDRTATSECQI